MDRFYYEIEVVESESNGTLEWSLWLTRNCGAVGIGFASQFLRLDTMPGWTSTYQSWGYHGNDGHKYGNNFRVEDGHLHGSGDTVGAGVDFTKREVFFTKNGIRLGTSFSGETIKGKLSPMIGCGVRGIKIRTNFWVQDFKYPFE
ncbi:concanavalin A-like lectin/glucanase domain-containing protein [Phyllosticta citriasiana]|uniref:concanavalin A-like lectin/glucanase domain-containing protein n=1 Tax=Phyllosticta citriasiana TaxID=595635 RepID=UPI0030FDC02E